MKKTPMDFRREELPPDLNPPIPPPPGTVDQDFESDGQAFPAGNLPTDMPQKVFATRKRWRAIDVYVQAKTDASSLAPLLKGGVFSVFVYAIVQVGQVATRVLVGSGRWVDPPHAVGDTTPLAQPQWICAVRCEAQTFEVDVFFGEDTGAPDVPIIVTYVASDQAVTVAPTVGAMFFSGNAGVNVAGVSVDCNSDPAGTACPFPELVGVTATIDQTVAPGTPRFLLLLDDTLPLAINEPVIMAWPLGSNPGDGIFDRQFSYRATRGIVLRASTNPLVVAGGVTDVAMTATIK